MNRSIGSGPFGRRVRRLVGRPLAEPRDPFAEYRSIDGPRLAGGPTPRHEPGFDDDPRLIVLMPHLMVPRMSGGPNTILQITARLLPLGIRIRYVGAFGRLDPDAASVAAHIRDVTGIAPDHGAVEIVDRAAPGSVLDIGRNDVLFATWWPTAYVARAALEVTKAREFIYLVQDYEPGFYPWSTKHALAAATYDMPMRSIVNEPLLLDHFRAERAGRFADPPSERDAIAFMPAVDRSLFAPTTRPAGAPRRLVFYARPRNPRNLFELGLRALRTAAAEGVFDHGEWEFHAVGQDLVDLPLSERHTLLASPWRSYRDYASFLGGADVLLALMLSPHTSYPPLEMAVAGGLVVTNTYRVKTAEALAAISPAIRAVEPNVDALVGALREAVESSQDPDRTPSTATLPGSWDESLAGVIPWLRRTIEELREG